MTQKQALQPTVALLSKLGSALIHADEAFSPDGRNVDKHEFQKRMEDPEVQEWIKAMGVLLPLKRETR